MPGRKPLTGGEELELFSLDDIPRAARAMAKNPPAARDVLVEARELHGWTLDKLTVLQMYLSQYRRVAGNGNYIDAFAGGGHYTLRRRPGELLPGSPLIAGRSQAFKNLHLFDIKPRLVQRLEQAIADDPTISATTKTRMHVHLGDANVAVPALLASGEIDPKKPCFCFMDPNSTELAWSTIKTISEFKTLGPGSKDCKVELWVLFNLYQVVQRLWPRKRPKSGANPYAATLNRLMGGETAWIDLWVDGKTSTHLLHRYRARLEGVLGYTWAIPQIIRDPGSGRPQYYMIHASDHDAAVSFMRFAKRAASPASETIEMFKDLPRSRKPARGRRSRAAT